MKVYGPYLAKDNRKRVVILHDDGTRTTKSYPRVLLEAVLGRELLPDETVDHIDGDCTNDSLENLRILSRAENAAHAWVTGNSKPKPMSNVNKEMHRKMMQGSKNILSKFTEEQVRDLRGRKMYYGCIKDWMIEFNVSRKTIYSILNNKTYRFA